MSISAALLSRVIAVFGLSLLLGVFLLLSTQWALVSFRPNLVEVDNLRLNLSTADPRQAREHALQRQGSLRQTKGAGNDLRAAIKTVQPPEPEQWPDQATDQQLHRERSAFVNTVIDPETGPSASQPSPSDLRTQHSQPSAEEGTSAAVAPSGIDTLPNDEAARCRTVLGGWCQHALQQHAVSQTTGALSGNLTCHADCNGVGNCNAITEGCDCPAGGSSSKVSCDSPNSFPRWCLHEGGHQLQKIQQCRLEGTGLLRARSSTVHRQIPEV